MQFRVRVVDGRQQIGSMTVEALDADDARQRVGAQGLKLLSLEPARGAGFPVSPFRRARKFRLQLFAQELHALLAAGLSVIESVQALLEKEPDAANRSVLEQMERDLRAGHKFSSALQRQSEVFPPLFVGMVQSAERTSNLAEALQRFIDYQARLETVRAKVVSAAVYPAILFLVGGGVTLFLLVYVVPKFSLVYQGTGRALPWASQLLLAWGHFVVAHTLELLLASAAAVVVLASLVVKAHRDGSLMRGFLRWPWIGERLRLVELSRLYLTLGLLLEGGMAIGQALTLLQSVGSPDSRQRLERLRRSVLEGQALSVSLEREGLTTSVAARLLKVGEHSGQLGAMLRRAALFYEGETARWIDRFTRAFEPALMAVIGVVIGLIVLLLYMPIFDLAGSFQ